MQPYLATDYLQKARDADRAGERLQAISFYFQAFRSIEKYLGEAIRVNVDNKEVLLVNEIYASIQSTLDKINLKSDPSELSLNRRLQQSGQTVTARANFKDTNGMIKDLPLFAGFEKGAGDVFPNYKTDENGQAKFF